MSFDIDFLDCIKDTKKLYTDNRGYCGNVYSENLFYSFSKKNVFRGFHGQIGQNKSITVLRGEILDMIMNPENGNIYFMILTDKDQKTLSVPLGWCHGFLALKKSLVLYKLSDKFDESKEFGFSHLGLTPLPDNVILSERDKKLPRWRPNPDAVYT